MNRTPGSAATTERPALILRLFGLPMVLGLLLVYLVVFFSAAGNHSLADNDVWWHLRDAQILWQSGHFIHSDALTFTVSGRPWVDVEWLGELPWFFAWRWLGEQGLYLVMVITGAAILLGIYLLAWMRSRSWGIAFGTSCVALLLMTVSLLPRPLLIGWLLLIAEVGILWGLQRGRDFTAWLPVLFFVWINTHGSWFIGFVLMAVFFGCGWMQGEWGGVYATRWSAAQRRKLVLVVFVSAGALFVNPYGWRLVWYPLDMAFGQNLALQHVAEWGGLDFHSVRGKVVVASLAGFAVLQLTRGRRRSVQDLVLATIAIYGGLAYVRFLFLTAIVLIPMLAESFARDSRKMDDRQPTGKSGSIHAIAAALILAMTVHTWPGSRQLEAGITAAFPERALPALKQLDGTGNLFNSFNWGGYLEWEAPEVKTFIDPRVDIFVHSGVMKDYLRATQLQDTLDVLDRYRIQYAILGSKEPMTYLLEHNAGWHTVYDDGQAAVLTRTR